MRTTKYLLYTLKETPHDAKIISHQLMLRSGMIRKLSTGLYIWLPTGIRILKKIKKIIEKEMKKINAFEISMPIMQPEYLWKESGRLKIYGDELLSFFDRRKNNFILSPTNEEIITYFVRNERYSYKSLPVILYQIKEKFRDEIRPRCGVVRAREFIMKDAYSFHINQNCLEKTYDILYQSYCNIFKKIKINFHVVKANSGSIGGNISHEFQALSPNGEDEIVFSSNFSYATNMNLAESLEKINFFKNYQSSNIIKKNLISKKKLIKIPHQKILISNHIKTILVKTNAKNKYNIALLLIRSDHEINVFKIEKIDIILKPITFVNENETMSILGIKNNFLGPIGLNVPIIADVSVAQMKDFTIGANIENHYFINVNWDIDLPLPIIKDIRKVTEKDMSPDGMGLLKIRKSIEIGHIFQLGQEYSKKMNASIKQKNGNKKNIYMGCYGIGITRIIASIIEQNHDSHGIIWPIGISPFEVAILPINMKKYIDIYNLSEFLYKKLKEKKIEVILDDRNEQPGIMFSEMDLIGIPHQIIVSPRCIKEGNIEYRQRRNKKSIIMSKNKIIDFITTILNKK
ncbi:proline--tRNA ligase [Buchnera aphidicola]|uniref:proline--tRNA ligase n=1 Tax=Buchnera aphidicola TaxID=9 RepID=UPI003BEED047